MTLQPYPELLGVDLAEPFSSFPTLLGRRVNKSLNLVGCRSAGVLFLLFGFWRPDLLLQLQLCPVSPCWSQAAEQQFFPFVILFSFNPNSPCSNNCEQDAVLISIINGCTSVYSATVIYSIIGFRATENFDDCMAEWVLKCKDSCQRHEAIHSSGCASLLQQHPKGDKYLQLSRRQHHTKQLRWGYRQTERNKPSCFWTAGPKHLRHGEIPERSEYRTYSRSCCFWGKALLQFVLLQGVEGTGLAFIVFTEAIIKMPVSPLWAVLFFVMLFCLGLSTMFGNIEGVVVPLQDLKLLPRSWPKEVFCGNFLKMTSHPVSSPETLIEGAELISFCFISRSHLFGVLFTWAHIRHALRKLLASTFWQLCRFYSSSGYRLLWNGFCHLHLWRRQVGACVPLNHGNHAC